MLPLELLYEQYKQISKTCKEVFIDKFYVHMPKIVEEQKKKSDKSAFADIFHMYLAVLQAIFDQSNLPLLTRCSRNPSQPFTISLYVISKSPVYHGSAIFPGQSV